MEQTRPTLLERIRADAAEPAWEEFYRYYWEPIVRYARKMGLSESEAEDVLQETMIALMRILPGFQYNPGKGKFRNFLLTIVHRRALAAFRRAARYPHVSLDAGGEEDGLALGERLEAEPTNSLESEDEHRWQQCLAEKALRAIAEDPKVDERTFRIFRAYALENRPCSEVAREFAEKPNNIYQIRNRLLRRLQQEVAKLEDGLVQSGAKAASNGSRSSGIQDSE
jgi:RNA polymerase sigma factor (sigma-70 family)